MTGKKSKQKDENINQSLVDCVWGLICSLSATDEQTKNISLFNVIEQFNIPTNFFDDQKKHGKALIFPIRHEIILFWRRKISPDISDIEMAMDIKIKTIDPHGQVLQEIFIPFKFFSGRRNIRLKIPLIGLQASIAGDYVYRVEIKLIENEDFRKAIEIPFEIKEVKIKNNLDMKHEK